MDYSKLDINPNDLLASIAYKLAESPTTQAYNSVAAQSNPDWAGFVGSIHRQGDIDRAGFNLGLQALTSSNATKEARAREQRGYNHAKNMYNLHRKDALADRNRAERLKILAMDDEEYLSPVTDWQNSVNPEQKEFINDYNTVVDGINSAKTLEDSIKNRKLLQKMKKANMFTSKVTAPDVNPNQSEYIHGEVTPLKRAAWKLQGFFGNKEANNKLKALEDLAQKSSNTFNNPNRTSNQGLLGLKNMLFGDSSLGLLENFIRRNNVGKTAWNSNNNTIAIAQKLLNSPEIRAFFGTNDLNNFELLSDPTNFGMNKMFIVDKSTNKPYQVVVDDTGVLSLYDPYER